MEAALEECSRQRKKSKKGIFDRENVMCEKMARGGKDRHCGLWDRMGHSFQAAGNGWPVEDAKHQHRNTGPDTHFVSQSGRQGIAMGDG